MAKVFVGLSGGVDSAVSAALLKNAGHDVTGVFIKIWSPEFLECTWREDRIDAKRVAVHLGIPFIEIDLSKEYLDAVISDMVANYKRGRTPNPDVLCNRHIKFGAFKNWALSNGADSIATGHYARVEKTKGTFSLLRGVDPGKDQTYFLHRLSQEDLSRTFFPVGEYAKKDIRIKAREFGLPNAERPDSQGLCFVGDVSIPEFLSRFISVQKGPLLDENGRTVGDHDGAALYTVGQRYGLHLHPSQSGPYYVTHLDIHTNIVYASKNIHLTERTHARISDMHWINSSVDSAQAVARYHAKEVLATIVESDTGTIVAFSEPLQITPGQSLVMYQNEKCLGGGVLDF